MPRLFTKENMARLEPEERGLLMRLQMSFGLGGRSDYLPDDCSGCDYCGTPHLGSGGFCPYCHKDWKRLVAKAIGEEVSDDYQETKNEHTRE